MLSNIRSVLNKRDDLSSFIDTCNADVVALTETWLSAKVSSSEILHCQKSFHFYRCDRGTRAGGGVLIAIADTYHSFSVPISSHLEIVCAGIRLKHRDTIFCVCYRPPNASASFCNDLHDVLNNITLRFPKSSLFLLGDFNYPKIVWTQSCPGDLGSSRETAEFLDLCSTFHFSQLVTQPTRISITSANVLDLVLTTSPDLVRSLACTPGLSDHCFIHFSIKANTNKTRGKPKYVRDYRKADYLSISKDLELFLMIIWPHFMNELSQQIGLCSKTKCIP